MSNKLLAAAIVTQYDGMCVKAVGLHVFHSPFIFLTVIQCPPPPALSVTYYCVKSTKFRPSPISVLVLNLNFFPSPLLLPIPSCHYLLNRLL